MVIPSFPEGGVSEGRGRGEAMQYDSYIEL